VRREPESKTWRESPGEKALERKPWRDRAGRVGSFARALPGIQALFGFQPIAGFKSAISTNCREPNSLYVSLILMMIAIIKTLAAYHRSPETLSPMGRPA
jgi:hypothetical protein